MLRYFLILPILIILFTSPVFADNGTIKTISNSSKDSINSSIAIDGKNIFIAWAEHSRSGISEIFFSKSTDGGQTFTAPQRIIGKQGSSIVPSIATDGTDLYITWTYRFPDNYSGAWSDDNSEIHFSKSIDGGKTFSTPLKISDDDSFSSISNMAIDGKNIFITWFNHFESPDEVFFSKSIDGGETFSTPQNISNNKSSHHPFIATDGTNILVTWSDDSVGNSDIFFSKSADGGKTFSIPQNISNNSGNSVGSYIATNGTDIYITWFEFVKGSGDIFYSKSADGGKTFSTPQNISNDPGNSIQPAITTYDNNVFIAWTDSNPNSSAVLLSKSTDYGETFDEAENISGDAGFANSQSIATNGKNISITWNWAKGSYDFSEIFFTKLAIESNQFNENNQINNSEAVEKMHTYTVGTIQWLESSSSIGDYGILKIVDPDKNVNPDLIDIFTAKAWSETDSNGITLDMVESGKNTSEFFIDVEFTDAESGIQKLKVSDDDIVTALYQDTTLPDKSQMLELTNTIKIIQEYLSPYKQIEEGIHIDDITCMGEQHNLYLKDDTIPLCLSPDTYEKLVNRGYFK